VGQLALGKPLQQDLEGLVEPLAPAVPVDLEEPDLHRRHPRADAELQPPAAEVVEHADLVDQPQRVVERQAVDERPEPQRPRPLRRRREEDARRRRVAQGCAVVLGEVVGVEPSALVALEQLQPLLELLPDRQPRLVDVVEDPELHAAPPVPPMRRADYASGARAVAPSTTDGARGRHPENHERCRGAAL
jgi:hypothetical protein